MPLYEYRCRLCSHRFEKIEKVSGPHTRKCPKCRGGVERLVTAPAIQFKGSGWYVTDYARKGAAPPDSKGEAAKNETPEKEAKETAPAKESKKAPKEK